MRSTITALACLIAGAVPLAGTALAQAPAAGSAGGGGVGASVPTPTAPAGKAPPGTPDAANPTARAQRDGAGQAVIGHTATPPGGVPGNTGAPDAGVKK